MAELRITIPESPTITAAAVIAVAARRAGYQGGLPAYLAEHVHQLYSSGRVDEVLAEVAESLPRPERPERREAADTGEVAPERIR